MIYNKIPVAFGSLRRATAPEISYQYDVTQILVIKGLDLPEIYTVDFCNEGDASTISIVGSAAGVAIPDAFLQTGKTVKGYIVLTGEDNDVQTRYEITIPVNSRPTRTDITPTPAEQMQIDTLIAAMNDAVDDAEQAAENASGYADDADGHADAAEGSANDAAGSATLSESWAIGGTGTRAGEDTNNASYYAYLAQQGAEASGFVWFDINDSDGQMYVTITPSLAEDVNFSVNENTGEMEINYV